MKNEAQKIRFELTQKKIRKYSDNGRHAIRKSELEEIRDQKS